MLGLGPLISCLKGLGFDPKYNGKQLNVEMTWLVFKNYHGSSQALEGSKEE